MKHHLSDRRPATYFCRELIFTFLALLCFAGYASGVEVWSGIGPAGGQVNILAVDPVTPTTLYAGGSGGVFQSTTAGASWAAASKGITETTILALAIDPENPDTLYAGTDGGGVFPAGHSYWLDMHLDFPSDLTYEEVAAYIPRVDLVVTIDGVPIQARNNEKIVQLEPYYGRYQIASFYCTGILGYWQEYTVTGTSYLDGVLRETFTFIMTGR